jgi:hypothetical protein
MQKSSILPLCSLPFHLHACLRFCAGVFIALAWLALSAAQAQTTNYALGASALVVGPAAGSNSVVLEVTPQTGVWTATTNATWLHLTPANQSGTGSTNVVFCYDANSGPTRSGTLTIGDQTLTVTQAGSTYVAAGSLTGLGTGVVPIGEIGGLFGVAVDGAGNVFNSYSSAYRPQPPALPDFSYGIEEWMAANNTGTTLASSSSWGLNNPKGLAVDGSGNVYIADIGNNAIEIIVRPNLYPYMYTLVSGLNDPTGVAVDGASNVYIANSGNNAIEEWTAANSNVITLVSSGLSGPEGVAADCAGNVYIADTGNGAIKEWMAANSNVITLVSNGLSNPQDVAVDGAGNVYIADTFNKAIKKWMAANNTVTTLVASEFYYTEGVAVDGTGNIYIAYDFPPNGEITSAFERSYAFVDPTPKSESATGGCDTLPGVLPATENLLPPFYPTSDQGWLTINDVTNGVVSFFCYPNYGSARTAHITLLGQTIPVTQAALIIGTPPTLTGVQMLGNGIFQFSFTNISDASFTVLSTTDLSVPIGNWTVAGYPVETPPGIYQFTSQPTTNDSQVFFSVISP